MKVLFVCTANIARSPLMELWARQRLGPDSEIEVASAGTHGFVDHPVDPGMVPELEQRGLVYDAFRSRRLTPQLVREADLVLTAEAAHRRHVLDDVPEAFRKVFTIGQFADALARVPPGPTGPELVAAAAAERGPAGPDNDVADPHRRGPEAAAACAAHLEQLLDPVLQRLAAHPAPGAAPHRRAGHED